MVLKSKFGNRAWKGGLSTKTEYGNKVGLRARDGITHPLDGMLQIILGSVAARLRRFKIEQR